VSIEIDFSALWIGHGRSPLYPSNSAGYPGITGR
jgi:hypothetical protein